MSWWLHDGDQECPHCGHLYFSEVEFRCADCDGPGCPHCRITHTLGHLVCPDCIPCSDHSVAGNYDQDSAARDQLHALMAIKDQVVQATEKLERQLREGQAHSQHEPKPGLGDVVNELGDLNRQIQPAVASRRANNQRPSAALEEGKVRRG
jgi:hypothetical protein